MVGQFLIKFEDAMRQRGLVLGENTDLPTAVSAATGVRSSVVAAKKKAAARKTRKRGKHTRTNGRIDENQEQR